MLEQMRAAATVFERVGDDWVGPVLVGDVVLGMPESRVEVPLAGLYAGLAGEDRRWPTMTCPSTSLRGAIRADGSSRR